MAWRRPKEELNEIYQNHIRALEASAKGFDNGDKWEATRLATTVYTLLHDGGRNSRSILSQMGVRAKLRFVSSATTPNPRNLLPQFPLLLMQMSSEGENYDVKFMPLLDTSSPFTHKGVQFPRWWEAEAIFHKNDLKVSRRELVFALRNKEGGAHVDDKLTNKAYLEMSRGAHLYKTESKREQKGIAMPIAGSVHSEPDEIVEPVFGVAEATMRQIAWELLTSLRISNLL